MIKRLFGYLLLIAVALPASAAFDIGQLMGDLARHKGGKAKFVEKKYFAILDKPVVSTGEMTYTAPDRLEKRTLTPKVETLLLDKDILSIERDKQKLSINLANQPEALAFVDSIRGTLSGNRAALEKNYALHLAGNADKWVLTLLPSDQKIGQPGAAHHGQRQQEPGAHHRIPAGRRRSFGAQHRPGRRQMTRQAARR